MKKNIWNNFTYYLILLFFLLVPMNIGLYQNINSIIFIPLIVIIIISFLLEKIITKKKGNINTLDKLIFLFSLIYFPIAIIKKQSFSYAIYHFLICNFVIVLSKVIKEKKKEKEFLTFLILLCTICSFFSIVVVFSRNISDTIGLRTALGDFYNTAIYRLYGIFSYPNTLALISSISLILLFFEDKNKILTKICLYINFLSLMLTISKTIIFLFFLFTIIITIIEIKKQKNKSVLSTFISLFIPTTINMKVFLNCYYSSNFIIFIIISIILFLIYNLICKCISKNKIIFIIVLTLVVLFIIFMFFPISIPLEVKHAIKENNIVLADLYSIEKNSDYTLNIEYLTNKEIELKLVKIIDNNIFVYNDTEYENTLSPENNKTTINFKSNNFFEYYYLNLSYEILSSFKINKIELINNSKNESQIINTNYLLYPSTYINQIKAAKYDIGSINGRMNAYKDSIHIFNNDSIKEEKIFGHGFKYFKESIRKHIYSFYILEEHSYLFKLLIEVGIFGLVIYLSILIYSAILIIRNMTKKGYKYILVFLTIIFSSTIDFTMSYNFVLILFLTFLYYLYWNQRNNKDVMFISSSGGHLTEILEFKKFFNDYNYILITEKNRISSKLKGNININYLLYSSRYYVFSYILKTPINIILSCFYFIYYNPKVIVTTGTHSVVPTCILGKLFKKNIIYIEVYDRIKTPTLTAKIIYKFNLYSTFIIQHEELHKYFKKATYLGERYL